MTTTNPSRRLPRRAAARRSPAGLARDGRSAVGEQLRDAREIKGIDLFRAERDTKIRSKYLAALEDGDFTDLPGDVYTRGFLRNYATYLGLDPDEVEEGWRSEAGAPVPGKAAIVGPQPLTIRRGVVFQRSHGVIAVVLVIILIVTAYFGFQLTRYLSYPTVSLESPGVGRVTLAAGTTTYVLRGVATPGTTVLIAWNNQDPNIVVTDDSGHWTYQAALQAGSNEFDVTAKNLDTSHASQTVRLIVLVPVPTPTPVMPVIAFSSPADGTSIANGAVTITGISTAVASVSLTPIYLGPPLAPGASLAPATPSPALSPSAAPTAAVGATSSPGASVSPSALPGPSPTPGPLPVSAATGADGTFSITIQLNPGRWQLKLVGTTPKGISTDAVSRNVTVPFKGLAVLIQIKGGATGISVSHDGVTDTPGYSQADGWSMSVAAKTWVCIRASRPQLVYITVNGASYGAISGLGGQRAYITATGATNANSCP